MEERLVNSALKR